MTDQSKFVLAFDNSATDVNRRPNLKGEYRLAGEATLNRVALWGGVSEKTGKLYARGKANPDGVSEAIRASATAQDVIAPANIDLKVGEAVLFENPNATADNKQPTFFGYAREGSSVTAPQGRYVRLAGWQHGSTITGTAEPYRPATAESEPAGDAPKVR